MLNVKNLGYCISLVLLFSCSGGFFQRSNEGESGGLGYHRSLSAGTGRNASALETSYEHAFEELWMREKNVLEGSAFQSIHPSFDSFNKQYKKFSYIVFPKNHSFLREENGVVEPEYEKPIRFQWELLFFESCQLIVKKENTSEIKYSAFQKLESELKVFPELKCGVFKVMGEDQTEVNIYMDSFYRAHALSRTFTLNGKKKEVFDLLDISQPLSSGLLLAPIDLPMLLSPLRSSHTLGGIVASKGVELPKNQYVQNKFMEEIGKDAHNRKYFSKIYQNPCPGNGKTLEYYNRIGDLNRVGWCLGFFMPQFIENQNYAALLDYSMELSL